MRKTRLWSSVMTDGLWDRFGPFWGVVVVVVLLGVAAAAPRRGGRVQVFMRDRYGIWSLMRPRLLSA